jgi:hypothetical protein
MRIHADTCSLTVRLMIFCRMDKLALFRFTTEQGAMEPPYVLTLIVVPRNMKLSNTCIHMHMPKMHRRRWCLRSNRQGCRLEPADQVSFPHAVDITSTRVLRHTPWHDFGAPDKSVVKTDMSSDSELDQGPQGAFMRISGVEIRELITDNSMQVLGPATTCSAETTCSAAAPGSFFSPSNCSARANHADATAVVLCISYRRRHAAVQLTQQVLQPDPEPHPYSMPVPLLV